MAMDTHDDVRNTVRSHYAKVATEGTREGLAEPCCGTSAASSLRLGYSEEELAAVPEGANLGLGCGNPHGIAALQPGETVLDLGSGAGFDCFLAAQQVGPTGRVIGVDMTPEMLGKARDHARRAGVTNVEFRLGEVEHLPLADGTVDVVLSNCVINLVPDKRQVYREILRVLRPGGRVAISDVVALEPIPDALVSAATLSGCVAGAATVAELDAIFAELGFEDGRVTVKPGSRAFIADWFPGTGAEKYVASAMIEARRPAGATRPAGTAAPTASGATATAPDASPGDAAATAAALAKRDGGRGCCGG